MKRSTLLFLLFLRCGMPSLSWAGPVEEIAQVHQQAVQAINDGNLARWASRGVTWFGAHHESEVNMVHIGNLG